MDARLLNLNHHGMITAVRNLDILHVTIGVVKQPAEAPSLQVS
jgi:hypothetical protein